MQSASQHTHCSPKRLKSPLHALQGAIAANDAPEGFAPGAAEVKNSTENLTATFASDQVPAAANAADADGFVRIAPLGQWPHSVGLQLVDDAAAANMVSGFKGALARVARFFGSAAVPVYRGHPDDAQFGEAHEDTTRYGEIRDLQARGDGLYARIEWTAAGNALLSAGKKLYYSPRWLLAQVSKQGGIRTLRPTKLLSVGLTPTPNIAGAAANETQPQKTHTMDLLKKLLIALGFSEAQAAAAAANDATAPAADDVVGALTKLKADLEAANAAKDKAETDLTAANEAKTKADADLAVANAKVTEVTTTANARVQGIAKVVVGQAIKAGVITAANEQAEIDLLLGHSDVTAAANALLARGKVINTQPTVSAADRTNEGVASAANVAAEAFEGKVSEIAANEKISRNDAWARAKKLHPDLFAAMNNKPAAQ